MLPTLDRNRFTDGMDASLFYQKKVSEFINKNKNTKEAISKYNAIIVRGINEVIVDYINPTMVKFGVIGNIARYSEEFNLFRSHLTIVQSLSKQRVFLNLLKTTLKRTKIDETWFKILKKYEVDKVITRVNRLNSNILPELIELSPLYEYIIYLESIGKTFEDDCLELHNVDWDSDEFKAYVDKVLDQGGRWFNALPKEQQQSIVDKRVAHKNSVNKRRELMEQSKSQQKLEKLNSLKDEIQDNLSINATAMIDNLFKERADLSTSLRRLYNKLDILLKEHGTDAINSNEIVTLAYHTINCRCYSHSRIKFVNELGEDLTKAISRCCIFLSPLQDDKIKELKEKFSTNGVVIEINILRAKDYLETNALLTIPKQPDKICFNDKFLDTYFSYIHAYSESVWVDTVKPNATYTTDYMIDLANNYVSLFVKQYDNLYTFMNFMNYCINEGALSISRLNYYNRYKAKLTRRVNEFLRPLNDRDRQVKSLYGALWVLKFYYDYGSNWDDCLDFYWIIEVNDFINKAYTESDCISILDFVNLFSFDENSVDVFKQKLNFLTKKYK